MPERKELRAEIEVAYQPSGAFGLAIFATASPTMPPAAVVFRHGFTYIQCYLSVAELREFCRVGLEIADAIEPERPESPSPAELREAFDAEFVGGPGIVGQRPEDQS